MLHIFFLIYVKMFSVPEESSTFNSFHPNWRPKGKIRGHMSITCKKN